MPRQKTAMVSFNMPADMAKKARQRAVRKCGTIAPFSRYLRILVEEDLKRESLESVHAMPLGPMRE